MKTIISPKIQRIIKNRARLMQELDIHITNRGREVTINGSPEAEFIAEQVIEALNFGFPYIEAISMKKENKNLEKINIKDHTTQKNLERVRGRVIGQGGKALKTLSDLTDSSIELLDNTVGIIAEPENMERAAAAVIAIIKGAKHGAVYRELENSIPKPIYDLGLKDEPVKTMDEYEAALKSDEDDY